MAINVWYSIMDLPACLPPKWEEQRVFSTLFCLFLKPVWVPAIWCLLQASIMCNDLSGVLMELSLTVWNHVSPFNISIVIDLCTQMNGRISLLVSTGMKMQQTLNFLATQMTYLNYVCGLLIVGRPWHELVCYPLSLCVFYIWYIIW
jgi:hypothetical protein